MSTDVVVDPETFVFCLNIIAFLGIIATQNLQVDFPFPDSCQIFKDFLSHQTVNLRSLMCLCQKMKYLFDNVRRLQTPFNLSMLQGTRAIRLI